MTTTLLRAVAVAIALAAFVDPPIVMTARARQRIALQLDTPAAIPALARSAYDTLAMDLRRDFDVVAGSDADAAAAVVVGSSYPDRPPADGQRAFTVTAAPTPTEPDVRIAAIRVPRTAPRGTLIHVEVDVDAVNAAGVTSTLSIRAGGSRVEVANATHTWSAAAERWRASMNVTPVDAAPWRLGAQLSVLNGERAVANNAADVVVAAADPLRILVYDPRPAWPSTFVRRALESDARFDVGSISYPSRGVLVATTGLQSLAGVTLDAIDAIVVGGLDRLTAPDAAVLDRFMRVREGAVVLLPDSRADLSSAAQTLPVPAATEVLLEKPAPLAAASPLPSFAASELLTFTAAARLRVLARASGSNAPVVVELPYGPGHLLISGGLDAWRYRADDAAAFERFWQAAIAGAAMTAPPAIDVRVVPGIVNAGEEARVHVRVRRSAFALSPSDPLLVSAAVEGGDPIRLWPASSADTFTGTFTAPRAKGVAQIAVSVDAGSRSSAHAPLVVARDVQGSRPMAPPLALLAASRGGVDVDAGKTAELGSRLREAIPSPATPIERRPMRSAWWIFPFTICLAGEWWIRRRRGLR